MAARTKYWVTEADDEWTYANILRFCAENSKTFSLVINKRAQPSQVAFDFLEALKPIIVCEQSQTNWPGGGTLLPSEAARVVHVEICSESIALLRKAARSLSDWVHPFLPEDLAFYRPDKTVFFAVVGHEGIAFFDIDPSEEERLARQLPELNLLTSSPI